jgi:predicted kinase
MSFQTEINKFPEELVSKLRNTKQNLVWHPEITVYNHIWLVYNKAVKVSKDFAIIALFHDLGKIDTTREKVLPDGTTKLVSYNHADYCKSYLDKYLNLFDYDDKDKIYEVCANHMKAHDYDKFKPSKKAEFEANTYFKETMEFSKLDDMSKTCPPSFIMLIGIPGSGKSSYLNATNSMIPFYSGDFVIVCPDKIRKELTGSTSDNSKDGLVWTLAKDRVIKALSESKNVILDATNTISKYRRRFMKGLPECFTYAKVFECTPKEAKQRIKNDINSGVDRYNVIDSVIDDKFRNFERDKIKIAEDGLEIL